jgi:hypothetical protein
MQLDGDTVVPSRRFHYFVLHSEYDRKSFEGFMERVFNRKWFSYLYFPQ